MAGWRGGGGGAVVTGLGGTKDCDPAVDLPKRLLLLGAVVVETFCCKSCCSARGVSGGAVAAVCG